MPVMRIATRRRNVFCPPKSDRGPTVQRWESLTVKNVPTYSQYGILNQCAIHPTTVIPVTTQTMLPMASRPLLSLSRTAPSAATGGGRCGRYQRACAGAHLRSARLGQTDGDGWTPRPPSARPTTGSRSQTVGTYLPTVHLFLTIEITENAMR